MCVFRYSFRQANIAHNDKAETVLIEIEISLVIASIAIACFCSAIACSIDKMPSNRISKSAKRTRLSLKWK